MLRKFFRIMRLKTTFYTYFEVLLLMVQSLVTLEHNITRGDELAFFTGETQSLVFSFLAELWFTLWCGHGSTCYRETTPHTRIFLSKTCNGSTGTLWIVAEFILNLSRVRALA